MSDCVFCKIVAGEIPSQKLFENDNVYAFLDINPLSKGHMLVIPKNHAERLHEISDDDLSEILVVLKKLALAANVKDYNILQNNGRIAHQVVPHVHFHLIPKTSSDGLGIGWTPISIEKEELEKVQKKIITNI
ncbi:MAG: HIT family protein [Candidatus Hodarchaeales archaeon]|jgi:diadenosine tetraphosphate (Ap4A) HIT family hydrolase